MGVFEKKKKKGTHKLPVGVWLCMSLEIPGQFSCIQTAKITILRKKQSLYLEGKTHLIR